MHYKIISSIDSLKMETYILSINKLLRLHPLSPFLVKIQDYYTNHITNDLDNEENSARAYKSYNFRLNLYDNVLQKASLSDLDSLQILLSQIPIERYSNDYYIKNHLKVIEINLLGHLLLVNRYKVTPILYSQTICNLIENTAFYEPICISDNLQRTLVLLHLTFPSYYEIFHSLVSRYSANPTLANNRLIAYPDSFTALLKMGKQKEPSNYLLSSLSQLLKAQSGDQTDERYLLRY